MKRTAVTLLSLLLCSASLNTSRAGEVLGVLEIRGLDYLAEAVFELTKAMGQPVPKEIVSLGVHSALGTMPGMGITPSGTLRALWVESDDPTDAWAVVIPVDDEGEAYLESLTQSGWVRGEPGRDGVFTMTAPDGWFMPGLEVAFALRGSTFVAAPSPAVARSVRSALETMPTILLAEGVVALELRPEALARRYGDQFRESMDESFASLPGQPPETAAFGRLYAKAYLLAAKQVQEFVLGLGVADGHLNLHTRIAPVEDRLLDTWIRSLRPVAPGASVVNLPDALLAAVFNLGDLQLLGDAYFQLMDQLFQVMPSDLPEGVLDDYTRLAMAYWERLTGDIGFAVLPPTREAPLRIAEYVSMRNAPAMRETMQRLLAVTAKMLPAMQEGEESPPLKIELALEEPRDYRDISIDRAVYRVTVGEMLADIWPVKGPVEWTVEMAWLPDALVYGIGGEDITEHLVDRALDKVSSPVSDLAPWQAFFPRPDEPLVEVSHWAVFDTFRAYLELLDAATGSDHAATVPDGPGYLGELSYPAMDGLMSRVRFSLADIAALAAKVQEAQQRTREARMEQMRELQEMMEAEGVFFEELDDAEFEEWFADDDLDDWEEEEDPEDDDSPEDDASNDPE